MSGKISNLAQLAYVRRYTLTDGKEAGLKIIEVNNGKLRFLLNESKTLDISQLWHEGTNISFLSKNGLTAREANFTNRFEGGMLYTCGLDSVGGRDGYELHGTHHNTPAKILRAECTDEGIVVVAQIEETELFGKNLMFTRTVKTAIGSDSVTIEDTLENRAYRDEEYCLLYHVNLGYPMLDEGVRIQAEEVQVTPRTPWARERIGNRSIFTADVPNEDERCYFIKHKTPTVTVRNETLGKTFTLTYSQDTLPCFVQWSSAASGDYALGLEPCTTALDERFAYSLLEKQSRKKFGLVIAVANIE